MHICPAHQSEFLLASIAHSKSIFILRPSERYFDIVHEIALEVIVWKPEIKLHSYKKLNEYASRIR